MKLFGLALVLGIASQGLGQITPSGKGYLFRAKYTKGQVLRFKINSTVKGLDDHAKGISVTIPTAMRVREVKKGIADIAVFMGQPTSGGQALPLGSQSAEVWLNSRNVAIEGGIAAGNLGAQFPEKSQAIGGSWKADVPVTIGPSRQETSLNTTYRFVGFKTVKGVKLAIITLTVSGTAKGSGRMLIKVSDGTMDSSDLDLKLFVKGVKALPVTIRVRRV